MLDFLEEIGDADNTIVILVSDNGASSEGGRTGSINDVRVVNGDAARASTSCARRIDEIGGPTAPQQLPVGLDDGGNTPFRRWKREVHEGGVADPCIVRLARAARRRAVELRHQFAHAIDVLPTVLELVGIDAPGRASTASSSRPIDGTSFAYLLATTPTRAERHTHAVLRDARQPRRSTTTAGRR